MAEREASLVLVVLVEGVASVEHHLFITTARRFALLQVVPMELMVLTAAMVSTLFIINQIFIFYLL